MTVPADENMMQRMLDLVLDTTKARLAATKLEAEQAGDISDGGKVRCQSRDLVVLLVPLVQVLSSLSSPDLDTDITTDIIS